MSDCEVVLDHTFCVHEACHPPCNTCKLPSIVESVLLEHVPPTYTCLAWYESKHNDFISTNFCARHDRDSADSKAQYPSVHTWTIYLQHLHITHILGLKTCHECPRYMATCATLHVRIDLRGHVDEDKVVTGKSFMRVTIESRRDVSATYILRKNTGGWYGLMHNMKSLCC